MTANQEAQAGLNTLEDVQNLPDNRKVALNWVGIRNVEVPIKVLQKNGKIQTVSGNVKLCVGLGADVKGTHMSRFVEQLTEWSAEDVLSLHLEDFLKDTKKRLNAPSANVKLDFRYFMDVPAPATEGSAPMAYQCSFDATIDETDTYQLTLGVVVPVTTLCPCSKEISDYGAHNQRTDIRVQLIVDDNEEKRVTWLEDIIENLRLKASCPVHPLLKRPDEKWVTERAYENPKFVEDVIRDVTLWLRQQSGVHGFHIEVEAYESIHAHNAWTEHSENFVK